VTHRRPNLAVDRFLTFRLIAVFNIQRCERPY
jgi:hypothetical protein